MHPDIDWNAQVQVVLSVPSTGVRDDNTRHATGLLATALTVYCPAPFGIPAGCRHTGRVKTIDEMLSLDLLSTQQHHEIASWVRSARTPEAIMAMPAHLWRAIEVASVAMNIDADLTRPPWLGADPA